MHPDMMRADLATDGRALRCCGRRFLNLSLRRSRPRATPDGSRSIHRRAASFVDVWITNLVSTGPTVRSGHPDEATRRLLEQCWARVAGNCDAEGHNDLTRLFGKARAQSRRQRRQLRAHGN
jgi:hypothetical protein